MIIVSCREETYRYNAFHMMKAFFPWEEVSSRLDTEQEKLIIVYKDCDEDSSLAGNPQSGNMPANDQQNIMAAVSFAESKNDAERQLYRKLEKLTGEILPWGILMGVRPTKPAMSAIDKGLSREQFITGFTEEKLVSPEKAALAWQIASKEKAVISSIENKIGRPVKQTYSLYIGIPFCPSICSYCSFSAGTISAWSDQVDGYLDALCNEIKPDEKPISVYIGGGTPTSLNEAQLERLLTHLRNTVHPENTFEFTLEAGRPDSITAAKLQLAKDFGVSRISINPQTMQQKTLDLVGRGHTVEQIYEAFELAREIGFNNINMDLIVGLPGEGCTEMDDTLQQIRSLAPDSLTVHALAIKRTSRMAGQCVDGRTVTDMITMARQAA